MSLRVGVAGYGYWGPNLVRNFAGTKGITVAAVADMREAARQRVAATYPAVATFADPEEMIARGDIDAIVIATPVGTHYGLARLALDNGKHVLVEKPMTRTSEEGRDLIARAAKASRVLMVDHTFLFTGAVQAMADITRSGRLGRICYFDSMRVNLGLFQPDVNCLWDLAPHDLSIIDHLFDDDIVDLEVSGYCHVDDGRPDMVFLTLHFAGNAVAHFNMSWMSPVKVRRFTIGGTQQMLIWDDLDQDQKIKIYDHGIEFQPQESRNLIIPEYRIGDIYSPKVSRREALAGVASHFAAVIAGTEASIMDGAKGLKVVEILERADAKLTANLAVTAGRRQGRHT
ncbi:MAG: Gfo/Idh/MocA family oxidoreductase [Hyphomicrobiaceae bacterium]|nr:Gfo/Idh/MocA family oxidoreductase [Hyphomicrobiaceae bacterium]